MLIPLSTLFFKTATADWAHIWAAIASPRVVASYRLSFGASFLGRGDERRLRPGRRLDAGPLRLLWKTLRRCADRSPVCLADGGRGDRAYNALCPERLDRALARAARHPRGLCAAGGPGGPHLYRPAVCRADACSRCWKRWIPTSKRPPPASAPAAAQTFFRVVLPTLWPAWLTGFALAFARALGEYGSVVFISGNMPMQDGDHAAPHHHEARAIRLRRRDGDRRRDARVFLRCCFF